MREIKFRAFDTTSRKMYLQEQIEKYTLEQLHRIGFGDDYTKFMQYTGLKDKNGVEIYEGCLLNIFFTSGNGEFIHDCIYKVEIGALSDIQFKFVRLLWVDGGHNQYPSSTTLCARYDSLDYEYENNQVKLKIPDSWGENRLHGNQWKCNDKSFYFKVIGNIYENPELLESDNE